MLIHFLPTDYDFDPTLIQHASCLLGGAPGIWELFSTRPPPSTHTWNSRSMTLFTAWGHPSKHDAVSMLGQRRRRWPNNETALGECPVFAGMCCGEVRGGVSPLAINP